MSNLRGFKDEIYKHLLGCIKSKILLKPTPGKELPEDSVITLNPNFAHKLRRIQISVITTKEREIEAKSQSLVEEERKHVIESVIIRIMKSRRELNHANLSVEILKLLATQFVPDMKSVKKRIESLIEREYLERDVNDFNLYRYKA